MRRRALEHTPRLENPPQCLEHGRVPQDLGQSPRLDVFPLAAQALLNHPLPVLLGGAVLMPAEVCEWSG
jgi:hypothetical protein